MRRVGGVGCTNTTHLSSGDSDAGPASAPGVISISRPVSNSLMRVTNRPPAAAWRITTSFFDEDQLRGRPQDAQASRETPVAKECKRQDKRSGERRSGAGTP